MANVIGSNLTSGAPTGNTTGWTTNSVTPTANSLILVSFLVTSSVSDMTATVVGNGITYTLVNSQNFDSFRRVFVYRGMSSSPSTGTIAITTSVAAIEVDYSVDQFLSVDTTGTNGSGAVVQNNKNVSAGTTTSLAVTLAAFGSVNNATFGAFGRNGTGLAAGSGFSQLAAPAVSRQVMTEWRSDNATSVNTTYSSTTSIVGGVALEIKYASPTNGAFLFNLF